MHSFTSVTSDLPHVGPGLESKQLNVNGIEAENLYKKTDLLSKGIKLG